MPRKNWLASIEAAEHARFYTEKGSQYKVIYSPVVAKDGSIDLKEKEKTSLYDYIQSFKDSCDINVLLRRYAQGDSAALMKGNPFYGDVTDMPQTYAEMLQVVIDGEDYFNKLPVDVKEKFGNNFYNFVSCIGSEEWFESLGMKAAAPESVPEAAAVKEGEVNE